MGANSLPRRVLKKFLYPLFNERSYAYFQAASKSLDIRSGSWSEPEIDLLPFAVKKGETAFDIGANFGLYSYHLSSLIGDGKIYAFEPVPTTFAGLKLVSKILRFQNVKLFEKGCSNENGQISFQVPVQQSGAFSAGQAYIGVRNDEHSGKEEFKIGNFQTSYMEQVRWSETREVTCEVIALDKFLPAVQNLSLIKIDIEGAELLAFRGAEKLILENLPTIICEINPWFLEGFGIKLNELTDFFFDKNYQLYFYQTEGENNFLRPVKTDEIVEDNYIFIHPTRLNRFSDVLANGIGDK